MKKITLLYLFLFIFVAVHAQVNTDSIAYQAQRKKINNMLAVRSQKFGKYDQSLAQHTGIFGLQTKKDIRRSNSILMDIVKTDNDIYKQLKILLDYRTFQQNQVQDKSKETQSQSLGFMYTINKLSNDNEQLRGLVKKEEAWNNDQRRDYIIIIIFILLLSGMLLLRKKNVAKN